PRGPGFQASLSARKQDGGLVFVSGAVELAIAALRRHAQRSAVFRMDQAHRRRTAKPHIRPPDRRSYSLRRIALAVHPRCQHPTDLRRLRELRPNLSLEIREPDLTDVLAR